MSLRATDGSINVTVVDGSTYVGAYAADGSMNVILATNGVGGASAPCGAYYVTVASSGVPLRAPDGSLYVSTAGFPSTNKGMPVTVVSGSLNASDNVEVLGTQISSGNSGLSNTLFYPNKPDTAGYWTLFQATTANAAAAGPDGSITAVAVTDTVVNNNHEISNNFLTLPSAGAYKASAVVKAGNKSRIVMLLGDAAPTLGNGTYAVYDLSGGQVGQAVASYGTGYTGTATGITSLGNGYYLCTLTATVGTGAGSATGMALTIQGDNGSGTGVVANAYAGTATSPAWYLAGLSFGSTTTTSHVLSNLIDDNAATWWEDYSPQAWAGVDMGSGNTANFTGYIFTPQGGDLVQTSVVDPYLDFPLHCNSESQFNQPAKRVQTSSDVTFATGVTLQDTLPSTSVFTQNDLHRRNFSGTARAARMISPYGHMSELRFLAKTGSTLNARPCRPTITPWSNLSSGSVQVTMTSETRAATIYYTTDGTTPTSSSTHYTAPFTLSPSSTTTVKAIAFDSAGTLSGNTSAVSVGHFTSDKIKPSQNWYDNNGVLIEAHDGGLIQAGQYIYWVGHSFNLASKSGTNILGGRQCYGVNLYRCTSNQSDPGYLKQWTSIGQILPQPIQSGVTPWPFLTRPHIVFNANNGTYCLAAHAQAADNKTHRCAFATATNIEGPWTWGNTSFDPSGHGFADCNFYTPDNSTAYLVYTGSPDGSAVNLGMYITKMDSTFVTSAVSTNTVISTGTREAPILVNNGTNTFLITSAVDPWPSQNDGDIEYCHVTGLDPIAPTWPALTTDGRLFPTTPPTGSYGFSQNSFVFKPIGKSQYIVGSDLWFTDTTTGYSSRQAWSPVTVTSTTLQATQPTSWDIGDLS